MQTEKVHLTQVKETALGALYFRAMDSRSKAPFLGDSMAEEAIKRIDYDFEGIKAGLNIAAHPIVPSKKASGKLCGSYILPEKSLSECLHIIPNEPIIVLSPMEYMDP